MYRNDMVKTKFILLGFLGQNKKTYHFETIEVVEIPGFSSNMKTVGNLFKVFNSTYVLLGSTLV